MTSVDNVTTPRDDREADWRQSSRRGVRSTADYYGPL